MKTRDWLAGWSLRHSRVLCQTETADLRAALVDTNGDGRELWFGVEVRNPSGEWQIALDWDDVDRCQPVGRMEHLEVIFGWGTALPHKRELIELDGVAYPVDTNHDGWWLLVAGTSGDPANTDTR